MGIEIQITDSPITEETKRLIDNLTFYSREQAMVDLAILLLSDDYVDLAMELHNKYIYFPKYFRMDYLSDAIAQQITYNDKSEPKLVASMFAGILKSDRFNKLDDYFLIDRDNIFKSFNGFSVQSNIPIEKLVKFVLDDTNHIVECNPSYPVPFILIPGRLYISNLVKRISESQMQCILEFAKLNMLDPMHFMYLADSFPFEFRSTKAAEVFCIVLNYVKGLKA